MKLGYNERWIFKHTEEAVVLNGVRRKKPAKRATGRFFALIAVVAICAVLIVIFTVNNNRPGPQQPPASQPVDAQSTDGAGAAEGWANTEIASISEMVGQDELEPLTQENMIVVDPKELSANESLDPVWRNILLLGTDARTIKTSDSRLRTDAMMILSINTNDARVKLVSLMRDMYVPIGSDASGKQRFDKLNAACYYGGPNAAMKAINECFGMNITEYVMVNFVSMQEAIDILGGVELDVTAPEMEELNHNIKEQARMIMTREEWDPEVYSLKAAGQGVHLTGMQAVGYARIRHLGNGDFDRTLRQRSLMSALLEKAKNDSLTHLMQLSQTLMGCVDTNISMADAIQIAALVMQKGVGEFKAGGSLPIKGTYENTVRNEKSALYDVNLEANAQRLYAFIYNE
jgi:LCP family protein required for cell wall assembly